MMRLSSPSLNSPSLQYTPSQRSGGIKVEHAVVGAVLAFSNFACKVPESVPFISSSTGETIQFLGGHGGGAKMVKGVEQQLTNMGVIPSYPHIPSNTGNVVGDIAADKKCYFTQAVLGTVPTFPENSSGSSVPPSLGKTLNSANPLLNSANPLLKIDSTLPTAITPPSTLIPGTFGTSGKGTLIHPLIQPLSLSLGSVNLRPAPPLETVLAKATGSQAPQVPIDNSQIIATAQQYLIDNPNTSYAFQIQALIRDPGLLNIPGAREKALEAIAKAGLPTTTTQVATASIQPEASGAQASSILLPTSVNSIPYEPETLLGIAGLVKLGEGNGPNAVLAQRWLAAKDYMESIVNPGEAQNLAKTIEGVATGLDLSNATKKETKENLLGVLHSINGSGFETPAQRHVTFGTSEGWKTGGSGLCGCDATNSLRDDTFIQP